MESQVEYILRSFRLSDSGPSANVLSGLSEPALSMTVTTVLLATDRPRLEILDK